MSLNPTDSTKETRRLKSIRRQLASRTVRQKIRTCFFNDILIFIVIMCTWFASVEYTSTGMVSVSHHSRRIYANEKVLSDHGVDDTINSLNEIIENMDVLNKGIIYQIFEADSGEILVEIEFLGAMISILCVLFCLFVVQVILRLIGLPRELLRVKRILKPLDEVALKADEFARMNFTEDKYQIIEDRLTSIEPDEQVKISLGDDDLLGIENAMNNLIKRIQESNKQQARFVNDASHELRTPIAVIQGYANMLSRWGREDEKVLDESISAIQNESENMKHLVEQLLFLARGDAGRTVINKEKISLNCIMKEVYEESLMIDENHIYKYKESRDDPQVMADEGLLKQAVRILVDNASKYTRDKDEIILSVGVKDSSAFLQVQDTGIGMKASDVEHMFERFYRADEARTYNGTGLGLSIAKWIIDKHKGHFEIVSREELGTRITIFLDRIL